MNKESCKSFVAGLFCRGENNSEICSNCPSFSRDGATPKVLRFHREAQGGKVVVTEPPSKESAFNQQVAGTHYKTLGVQPLELTLKNMGYDAFKGACYTKINKYMIRKKDNEVEQLKKARHILDMWIEEAERQS